MRLLYCVKMCEYALIVTCFVCSQEMPRIKARLDSVNARLLRPLDDVDTEQSYRKELWKNIFRTEALLHDAETP